MVVDEAANRRQDEGVGDSLVIGWDRVGHLSRSAMCD
jgi:hypothetical protein